MEFYIGDLITRARYIFPVYVITKIKGDKIFLTACTDIHYNCIKRKKVDKETIEEYYEFNFAKKMILNKDFLLDSANQRVWKCISTTDAWNYVRNHDLFNEEIWLGFVKSGKYIKPYDLTVKRYPTHNAHIPTTKVEDRKAYLYEYPTSRKVVVERKKKSYQKKNNTTTT